MALQVRINKVKAPPEPSMTFPFVYWHSTSCGPAVALVRRYSDLERATNGHNHVSSSQPYATWCDLVMWDNDHKRTALSLWDGFHAGDEVAWKNRCRGDHFTIANDSY